MPDEVELIASVKEKSRYRDFVLVALSTIAMSTIATVTDFVGTWILSQSDSNGLAAGGLFSTLRLLLQGFVYGFLLIVAPLASQLDPNEKSYKEKSSALFYYCILTAVILSVPMCLIYRLSEQLFVAEGQDANVSKIAGEAFRSYSWGAWSDAALTAIGQYAVTRDEKVATLLFLTFDKAASLALAYYLVLGSEGVDARGAKGLGQSYSIFS